MSLESNISLLCIGCICLLLLNMAARFRLYLMINGIQFFIPLVSILICSKLCLFFSVWLSLKLSLCRLNLVLNSFSVISMYVSFCFLSVLFDSFLVYHSLMEALVLERAGFFICVDSRTGLLWLEIIFHILHAAMA